jgi:hypothetical protein
VDDADVSEHTFTTAPVGASTGVDPEFVDFGGLEARFGIRRSTAYTLISENAIRSVVLRRRGTIKGRRLIEVASVRKFLASQPSDIDPQLSELTRKANRARRWRQGHERAFTLLHEASASDAKRVFDSSFVPFAPGAGRLFQPRLQRRAAAMRATSKPPMSKRQP